MSRGRGRGQQIHPAHQTFEDEINEPKVANYQINLIQMNTKVVSIFVFFSFFCSQ